ncbi:MAG TPA: hypothetical protein VFX59_24855 [Polyangiales bacterium]|nr:hypothetical protein [Polyangiales bacterium]
MFSTAANAALRSAGSGTAEVDLYADQPARSLERIASEYAKLFFPHQIQ